jgi:hypothetical protein
LSGTRAARNQEYVKPVARSTGKPVPYYFPLPSSPSTPKPEPKSTQPTEDVAEEESEEEKEPAVVYIAQAPIPKPPKPRSPYKPKPSNKPQSPTPPQSQPPDDPFSVKPHGRLVFNAYQFEWGKSDLNHTPANDKLIHDLVRVLKSSASMHLEIKGNVWGEPQETSWLFGNPGNELRTNRGQAIYDALQRAGVPPSQLHFSDGQISDNPANMSSTFILTNP